MSQLAVLLDHLDPDMGYEDWLHILMALFHETGGSDEGLELAVQWSSGGELDPLRVQAGEVRFEHT